MPDLVREHRAHLSVRERPVDHRAPQDDLPRRAEADCVGVRLARRATHVLHGDGDAGDTLLLLELGRRSLQGRIVERRDVSARRYGCANAKPAPMTTNTRSPGNPPGLTELPGEEHDDEQGDADRREGGGELEPAAERPFQVADLAQVVASRPPDVQQSERQLHEPDDPEAEHPEEHSRADRPRGRFAGEAGAPPGVDPQGREERDLGENPDDQEEALDVLGSANECLAEHRRAVDPNRRKVGRDGAAKEERGAPRPTRRPRSATRPSLTARLGFRPPRSSRASRSGVPNGSSSCTSRGRSRTAGAAYGIPAR